MIQNNYHKIRQNLWAGALWLWVIGIFIAYIAQFQKLYGPIIAIFKNL
jgi:hypothetical protein